MKFKFELQYLYENSFLFRLLWFPVSLILIVIILFEFAIFFVVTSLVETFIGDKKTTYKMFASATLSMNEKYEEYDKWVIEEKGGK